MMQPPPCFTHIAMQNVSKLPPPPLVLPQGAVSMRMKSSTGSGERLSQTKSMVIPDLDAAQKPLNRHRRNQSQHNSSQGVQQLQPSLHGVYLNKTKIAEGGKKFKKNWNLVWVVLSSNELHFYKESKQEAMASLKPGLKPEGVDLCGAVVDWTTEKSSRKNVIQITTRSGEELLLQSDDYPTISKWHDAIKKIADKLSSTSTGTGGGKATLHRSSSTECLARRSHDSTKSKAKEPKSENRRSLMFKLNYSASDSADKNGVKNRLKKFISRRPSMKTLQEKGLIKDCVFGCHMLNLCQREGTTVPRFVQLCVKEVEKRGLEVDGIYRVSANLATVQKLRFLVDQEEELNLGDSQWEDIHVITGALKLFFRELPEPLFPFRFFDMFVDAIKNKEQKQKVQALKKLVHQLPKPNHNTMKLLFHHLQRVLTKSQQNRMSSQGVSIVFGPTLMWPELDAGNMAVNMLYQNQIVEFMLTECVEIFGPESK
ncbi:rho GTPase-activating protein 15 isoform X1 [Tachysurus fulvidraco]|uniref:rho GTPase-activating protein 15 isoform X1 n=2 Tax=Tachysurus fulvidraco TaxID=1234273 RepID=UPI000F4FC560|nr:rho GTPase-activating protein 15 isoform X1 [Tachysurus fulvidraco]